MKFLKLFGNGCKELGMKVKPTKDGIEITPTVESMEKLMILMGGIPEASRGEKGVSPSATEQSATVSKARSRNPESLKNYPKGYCVTTITGMKKEQEHQDKGEKLFHELTYDKFKEKKKQGAK